MKILDHSPHASSAISYAGLIEKIEILRSTLRWASRLERHGDREAAATVAVAARRGDAALAQGAIRHRCGRADGRHRSVAGRAPPGPARAQLRLRGDVRRQPQAAGGAGDRGEGRAHRPAGADRRRERHRQGADGEGDPRQRRAGGPPVHLRQLRRDPREPARVRAVRPQQGAFTGAAGDRRGQVRGRARRHDLPRRDRRAAAVRAGEAAARAGVARDPARGRGRDHSGRRARRRRDEQEPAPPVRRGQVPRRPLLPRSASST